MRAGPVTEYKESFNACPSGREHLWKAGSQIQDHRQRFGHTVLWMTVSEEVKEMVTVDIIASSKSILETGGTFQYHMKNSQSMCLSPVQDVSPTKFS